MPDKKKTEDLQPQITEAGEAKTLLEWKAESRPYRKKDRSYYTTVAIIVILLILIAILAHEFLVIGVLLSFMFVTYVLAFVPPHEVGYRISTQGITIENNFYFWHDLESFWFREKEAQQILFIQTKLHFPKQLIMVLGSVDKDKVKDNIVKFLPFHEVPNLSLFDRWSDALQKHFPLENVKQ